MEAGPILIGLASPARVGAWLTLDIFRDLKGAADKGHMGL